MMPKFKIVVALFLIGLIGSCKTAKLGNKEVSYKEEIRDSISYSTLTSITGKFIYAELDSVQFKATPEDYFRQLESIISPLSESAYREALREVQKIISNELEKSDSVNLQKLKTSKIIKNTTLPFYPIDGLAKAGKLFVYDKGNRQIQDSIWEKSYFRETFSHDSNETKFQEGKVYTTRNGKEFFRVVLKSRR